MTGVPAEDVPVVVDGWVAGWAGARGVPTPTRHTHGWLIATGTERESRRWVLPEPTVAGLAELLAAPHPLGGAVKLPGERAQWLPRFGPGWVPEPEQWLLSTRLTAPVGVTPPRGYAVAATVEPRRVAVVVRTEGGEVAASGVVGLAGRWAVPDQIGTEAAHRRRGLGTVLMAALTEHALAAGADHGVLGATAEGKALYVRLGWTVHGGLVGAHWRRSV